MKTSPSGHRFLAIDIRTVGVQVDLLEVNNKHKLRLDARPLVLQNTSIREGIMDLWMDGPKDGRTDQWTDRLKDRPSKRVALLHILSGVS